MVISPKSNLFGAIVVIPNIVTYFVNEKNQLDSFTWRLGLGMVAILTAFSLLQVMLCSERIYFRFDRKSRKFASLIIHGCRLLQTIIVITLLGLLTAQLNMSCSIKCSDKWQIDDIKNTQLYHTKSYDSTPYNATTFR